MNRVLHIIEKEIYKSTVQNNNTIVEFICRDSERDIYIDGGVYKETKYDFIFIVNTGDWFNKTIRFDIAINTYDNNIVVRKGYGYDYKEYSKAKFKDIAKYINEEVIKFSLQDLDNRNKNIKKQNVV